LAKPDTIRGELVNSGGYIAMIALTAEMVSTQRVNREKNYVSRLRDSELRRGLLVVSILGHRRGGWPFVFTNLIIVVGIRS
jgi:hypothetical protein